MFAKIKRFFKIAAISFLSTVVSLALITTAVVLLSGDKSFQPPVLQHTINDVTQLNPTYVQKVIRPTSIEQVQAALRESTGPVSIGGGRYSQGGQTAHPDSVHLDMRGFNRVLNLDETAKTVSVQTGITWRQLQEVIDPKNLSVKIMQTYANFTVGGSLSVNVHGRYIGEGPLVRSVKNITVVLANGDVIKASPQENSEIFFGVIGGYGGLGVIVEATLQLEPNEKIKRTVKRMPLEDYSPYFKASIRDNKKVMFHNADIYPPDYTLVNAVSWERTEDPVTVKERLIPVDKTYGWQPKTAEFVANYRLGKWARKAILEPIFYSRNVVEWRNYEASYDVAELEPKSRSDYTYGLREYFVPVKNFDAFVPVMAKIFNDHKVNIINVSVRHALPDSGTLLAWAPEEVFAFVVYYRQGTDVASKEAVKKWSRAMVDATLAHNGRYYLPYQVHATQQQFLKAYPGAESYFSLKQQLDPTNRFNNKLLNTYYPPNQSALTQAVTEIDGYARPEEQTFLTLPEWYLVFQPVEYADYLEAGNNPSTFPFIAAVDEYWTLYDRVYAVTKNNYPGNAEYKTMLRVIGISTTFEYLLKSAYENTFGRFTRWTTGGEETQEDIIIQQAHRAYSDLLLTEPWYEFNFKHWSDKIWTDTKFFGPNFIRKLERKLFFTLEFGVKSIYGDAIKSAVLNTYGETDQNIYATATLPVDTQAHHHLNEFEVNILASENVDENTMQAVLALPRWGGFTETVPKLLQANWKFSDISANHQMVVTAICSAQTHLRTPLAQLLFESRVVSNTALRRRVLLVGVPNLKPILDFIRASDCELEHLFDY